MFLQRKTTIYIHYHAACRRRRHYVFGLSSVRRPVRPKPEIPYFHLYMGPLVHPTNRDRSAACPCICPSVRPKRFMVTVCWFFSFLRYLTLWNGSNLGFPGISWRTHEGNSLKYCMLIYLDHLQNWLVYGHGLSNFWCYFDFVKRVTFKVSGHFGHPLWIFLIMVPLRLKLVIWGFWALSRERVGVNVEGGLGVAYLQRFASNSV